MGCGRSEDVVESRRHDNCICEVVRAIRRIQDIRDEQDCDDCRTDCFLTPLGSLVSPSRQRANTRVFMLMNDEGDPFKAFFNHRRRGRNQGPANDATSERDCESCFSVFFRVQNIFDNCCATLQVLEPRDSRGRRVDLFKHGKLDFDAFCEVERFEATGSCVTVDLKCFCAVQCIKDVFIDCDEV
ncbi:spore coat protein CotZ [Sporosarcina sp. ACRSM]|uniref:CotY/CotZ family spore coat protein n=1 Tax=Sporosarcina sp. ACRSM TaxID=2918216 RepID=UPI001EF6E34D|nr:CotY/CotZ family spore coat protein [Sporosarcina sp. ACRSM]MCG7334269.1 spore coat protein CotZ [Sporosarcina sp. ACRSM]